uniref:Zinc finger protein n=2 Tax=Loa loa TaxID=7209 RepID=A0A1I7V6M6_LOALO
MDQDDAKSLNLPVQKASEEQTRIERKRKMSRENTTHTSEKRFKCKISKKDFAAPSNLRTHMRTRTGKKPIECKICGKIFTTTSSLREHMRIHNGEKPFSCSECNMSFTQSSTLREHMSIHNGEKPFACSECNMSFTQCTFSGLILHQISDHIALSLRISLNKVNKFIPIIQKQTKQKTFGTRSIVILLIDLNKKCCSRMLEHFDFLSKFIFKFLFQ